MKSKRVSLSKPVCLSVGGLLEVELKPPARATVTKTNWVDVTPPCFKLFGNKSTLLHKSEYKADNNTLAYGTFTFAMMDLSIEVKVNYSAKTNNVYVSTPGYKGSHGWTNTVTGTAVLSLMDYTTMLAFAAGLEGMSNPTLKDLSKYAVFNAWMNAYKSFCSEILAFKESLEVKDDGAETLGAAFGDEDAEPEVVF